MEDVYGFRAQKNELVYYIFHDFVFFNANQLSNIAMVKSAHHPLILNIHQHWLGTERE